MERHLKLFSPKPGFPSGFFLRFYQRRLEFLEELAGSNCPVAYFPFAGEKMYLVNEPDLIRDVLVLNHRRFKKGRGLERAKILLGEGLLTSDRRGITSNHWNFARIGGRRSFARRCRVLPFSLLAVPRGNVSARGLPGWKWPSYWLFCSETGIWSSPGQQIRPKAAMTLRSDCPIQMKLQKVPETARSPSLDAGTIRPNGSPPRPS